MDLQIVSTTVSRANQTAVPSIVRGILGLQPGNKLIWSVEPNKKTVSLRGAPEKLGDYMSGLGKEVWEGTDVEKYIKDLRKDRVFE